MPRKLNWEVLFKLSPSVKYLDVKFTVEASSLIAALFLALKAANETYPDAELSLIHVSSIQLLS